jgi:hypothetical protein
MAYDQGLRKNRHPDEVITMKKRYENSIEGAAIKMRGIYEVIYGIRKYQRKSVDERWYQKEDCSHPDHEKGRGTKTMHDRAIARPPARVCPGGTT